MKHYFLSVGLLLAIVLPCPAQGDKPKPNTLTPKEIADGWILLFDGETTFGWTEHPAFSVDQGTLLFGKHKDEYVVNSTSAYSEFDLSLEYQETNRTPNATRLFFNRPEGHLELFFWPTDKWSPFTLRFAYSAKPSVRGIAFEGRHSGGPITGASPGSPLTRPLQIKIAANAQLRIRNAKIRPLNTTSLFNGKALAGWDVFPKKKSQFAVIDGAINVKDGPGDLQTVGKYQDFVLQLECISNGKHLNSGIFFRCRDNEYQNGYEAQIRNEFKAEATQKYLLEEYDPKTNKLIGKKEQLFTAVDFGTGAIYRRQPARKAMSKDGEWFAMTIVAHGNHFATWVNGVQVADWTDNRPPSDNARTGYRKEGGHISIQGHDPTTDLSFRNIRIAELPSAK
jgi:hypothetical protein